MTLSGIPPVPGEAPFLVVGIGASAGGLGAVEQLLRAVPPSSGMAFVIIQHLDPDHGSMMAEILQQCTEMPVVPAATGLQVSPGNVYVIPPDSDLSIVDGHLSVLEPHDPRGHRLPVDFFFESLARERQEHAIGVVLSGMGADGTEGIRAIRENGGLGIVQDPITARFDAMPRSVIDAGLADIVCTPQEMADHIIRFASMRSSGKGEATADDEKSLGEILLLLRVRTGQDFNHYKTGTLLRRVERRMGLHQLTRASDYLRLLLENAGEVDLLFKELLIGVTSFFRDPWVWSVLAEKGWAALLSVYPEGRALRAWVPACSTGEEAYSLAISFREAIETLRPSAHFSLQIFATDLDPDAIERARQGTFPSRIAQDVNEARLARFFSVDAGGFRLRKEIRETIVFAPQNIIMDPPFTKVDLVFCRNLLIYMTPELQHRLIPLFHYCLNPGGLLLLGTAETTGPAASLFSVVDASARLYRRGSSPARPKDIEFPSRETRLPVSSVRPLSERAEQNLPSLAGEFLLNRAGPTAVLVNSAGDILYVNGRTGKYLEPAAGKANWNIYAMARDGLRHEIALVLPLSDRTREVTTQRGIRVESTDARVDLTVFPIDEPEGLRGMLMIVFTETPADEIGLDHGDESQGDSATGRLPEIGEELVRAREEITLLRRQMQTSQEDLRSANEELQSTNEELQSANEELTTSHEELQSLNEELQTVNAELQSKVDELSSASNDMKNLLNSTDIATIFLTRAMHIRRYTTKAASLFSLIPGDIGRPLSDITTTLQYAELMNDAREVLSNLVVRERQVPGADGHWYLVRIMPYRTLDDVVDGVVITLNDVSKAKQLEADLRRSLEESKDRGHSGGDP